MRVPKISEAGKLIQAIKKVALWYSHIGESLLLAWVDVRIVEIEEGESTDYYRDEAGIHYVPKRKLDDVIITR